MRVKVILSTLMILGAAPALADDLDGILQICIVTSDEALCEATKEQFRADWPKAMKGDYQAQRNVAFCLSTGCDGAVGVDVIAGCSWRMVVMASDATIGSSDVARYRAECGGLPKKMLGDAKVMAARNFRKAFGRKMGEVPDL